MKQALARVSWLKSSIVTAIDVITNIDLHKMSHEGIFRKDLYYQGQINDAAMATGITPHQIHKLLTKYDIRKEEFK